MCGKSDSPIYCLYNISAIALCLFLFLFQRSTRKDDREEGASEQTRDRRDTSVISFRDPVFSNDRPFQEVLSHRANNETAATQTIDHDNLRGLFNK
jgi:hypothetical protein